MLLLCRSSANIDRICGRRPCAESSDGFEYAVRYKGISYIHLVWIKKEELDQIDFKSTSIISRFQKKLSEYEEDANSEILLFSKDYYLVDLVLDCADAIIEINSERYISGWRMLSRNEELPQDCKIYNLPKPWRERLQEDPLSEIKQSKKTKSIEKKPPRGKRQVPVKNSGSDLSGVNPFIHFNKSIEYLLPEDESNPIPNAVGSIFRYERIYLVKWVGLSIAEATWERSCDFRDNGQIQQFFDLNTLPSRYHTFYSDYLPENYITMYDGKNDLSLVEKQLVMIQQQPVEKKRGRRGKGRTPGNKPVQRRSHHLRNCIDPIAPHFDKSK